MPLASGYSDEVINKNIEQLVKEGFKKSMAISIAYTKARKAAKAAGDTKRVRELMKGKTKR